jgi:hypothetical protein
VSSTINEEEVILAHFFTGTCLIIPTLLTNVTLQNSKDDDIEALVDMSGMCWIAEDNNFILSGVLEEGTSVMGVVAVNKEEAVLAVGFLSCLLIENLDPLNSNFTRGPSFLLITNSKA